MLPFLQGLDYSEEFPIVDVVVSFGRREHGGMVGTGMEISIGIFLHEYSSSGGERGIGHDKEGFGSVRHLDYWGR